MKDIINNISSKINELEKKRDELNHEIWIEKKKIKSLLTSKPGWDLFVSGYCVSGDKEDYVNGLNDILENGLETPNAPNLGISFEGDKVIVEDYIIYGYDGHDDWTFEIPLKKFIEFCSSDDYMQKIIDRYKSIKESRRQREKLEEEKRERELFETLKKKYEH